MKTTKEIQDMIKDCAKAIGEVTDGSQDTYKAWIEALNWVTMTNEQPEPVLATRHSDNEVIDVTLTEDEAFEEGFRQGKLVQKKDDDLPDGLQKYIDGVALNILHRNYHKSTNGIWSKAEVDEEMGDEWMGQDEYYVVNVDFGCQDDTRNEQYRESLDVWRDKETGEWTCSDSLKEDPADRDDRLYHEEQDHIAMEKAKETK